MNTTEIPNWLQNRSFLTPNRVALKMNGEEISFSRLHERVLRRAYQLSYAGVKKDDVVSILMKNSIEMIEIIHALKYIGVTTVLLNVRLTESEIEYQVKDSHSIVLISEEELKKKTKKLTIHVILKEELLHFPEQKCDIQSTFPLDKTDTIMYTSGTTGNPKGVIQTYGNHWWSAIGSSLNLGLHHDDCWLAVVPFFHISGLAILYRSVIYGIPVVIHESFDPKRAVDSIMNENVTIMSVVSVMLSRMVEQLEEDTFPKSFRCMLLGGGPAPKPLLDTCIRHNIPVYQTYGMTETASQVVTLSPEYSLSKLGSAGKPLFPVQLKIEKDGKIAEPYKSGEIVVKGPNVTTGYFQREKATKKSIIDGWLYTGDIGYLDEDGFLYVQDRRSDLIISGGENIYPAEIESVLLAHPSIQEVGVTGMDDEKWGQVPVAFIKCFETTSVEKNEVIEFCEQRLAKYKVPKKIYFVESLPRNASNKLMRRKLLELIN